MFQLAVLPVWRAAISNWIWISALRDVKIMCNVPDGGEWSLRVDSLLGRI